MMDVAYDSLFVANPLCEDYDGNREARSGLGSPRYRQHTRPFHPPWNTDTDSSDCNKSKIWNQKIRESAAANTVGKTMHGQSSILAEATEAMCTLRSPGMHTQRIY